MLLRMYLRWIERRGFKREVIDYQPGDEAGLKSVDGDRAGRVRVRPAVGRGRRASARAHLAVRLRRRAATRRLRRSTSGRSCRTTRTSTSTTRTSASTPSDRAAPAASTSTSPTRPSASRTCRPASSCRARTSARSTATRTRRCGCCKARLFDIRMKEQQAKLDQIGGAKKDIAFGHQIRSYVLHPYQMVKDHRTKFEVGDPNRVLDGDLDPLHQGVSDAESVGDAGPAGGGRRRVIAISRPQRRQRRKEKTRGWSGRDRSHRSASRQACTLVGLRTSPARITVAVRSAAVRSSKLRSRSPAWNAVPSIQV